jgi:tetratricopeptide (TPR) repeat protein
VVEVKKRSLGAEHHSTLGSLNNLGRLLNYMGSYEEAELLYRHALEGCEKVLGLEHPQTQGILQNFGNMLHKKGDFYGCILLYRSALKGCEKFLGLGHPQTQRTLRTMGTLLLQQRDYDGAETLFRRALEDQEKVLGAEHRATLTSALRLAKMVKFRGKANEAVELLRRYYGVSAKSADTVRYQLACYECFMGNEDRAKFLIAEKIRSRPEMKKVIVEKALADPDLSAIKDFIESL